MRIIPLGGLGEVGKNMTVFERDGRLLLLDAGLSFPHSEMFGIDLVLPDFSYVADRADRLEAIVLTHGHEDHIGALPYLLREVGTDAEVWGTRLTLGLVKSKLDEHGLLATRSWSRSTRTSPPSRWGRSAPSSSGSPTRCPTRWRSSCTPTTARSSTPATSSSTRRRSTAARPTSRDSRCLGDEGVALLMADSTNAERPGHTPSERTVAASLREIVRDAPGRVIVTSFSSHIHRLQQVIDAAQACGRTVCVIGRSMIRNINIARNLGYATSPTTG